MSYTVQKRILDLVAAFILAIIFLPFWLIIPVLVFFDSGWPVIYRHKRVGQGGKEFYLYKFRSMVKNADDILHHQNKALLKEFKSGDWKLANDPRITKLGKVLRSLTIDEFPQLYNVFRGDMSIVGPRAYLKIELDDQAKRYPETRKLIDEILTVKPGITGPWQTSGRNEVPFVVRAKMDAAYASQKDVWKDILILLKTPKAMISRW